MRRGENSEETKELLLKKMLHKYIYLPGAYLGIRSTQPYALIRGKALSPMSVMVLNFRQNSQWTSSHSKVIPKEPKWNHFVALKSWTTINCFQSRHAHIHTHTHTHTHTAALTHWDGQMSSLFHTEPSSSGIKAHQCVNSYSKPALRIQKGRDNARHDDDVDRDMNLLTVS